jgi:hypothetical protein
MSQKSSSRCASIVFSAAARERSADQRSSQTRPLAEDSDVVRITANLVQMDVVVTGDQGRTACDIVAPTFSEFLSQLPG